MNKRYQLINDLVNLVGRFEEENPDVPMDVMSFTLWLNESVFPKQDSEVEGDKDEVDQAKLLEEQRFDIQLSAVVGYLFRYAKHYSKKALKNTPLTTLDDYIFLGTLIALPGLTKSELIQQHLLEITSGTEILKRLLKQGFIEEYDNPEDKRSKRLKITPLGMKALHESNEGMSHAAQIVGGNLSVAEKARILQIGNKLKKFHDQIHENDKKSELVDILEKYF